MPRSPRQRLRDRLLLGSALTAIIGIADSAYLTIDHYFALPLPCTILHGCATVLTSKYATVGPIPLALFGVAFYALALAFALYLYMKAETPLRGAYAFLGLAAIGFVMSVIFESIQAFLIHALCMYCALSALCTLALLALAIPFALSARRDARKEPDAGLAPDSE